LTCCEGLEVMALARALPACDINFDAEDVHA
jgi:hypothetical protein